MIYHASTGLNRQYTCVLSIQVVEKTIGALPRKPAWPVAGVETGEDEEALESQAARRDQRKKSATRRERKQRHCYSEGAVLHTMPSLAQGAALLQRRHFGQRQPYPIQGVLS